MPLSDYAKAKRLELRPVYDAIPALRPRGTLPRPERPPQRKKRPKSKFVALRVTSSPASLGRCRPSRTQRSGVPSGARRRLRDRVRCEGADLGSRIVVQQSFIGLALPRVFPLERVELTQPLVPVRFKRVGDEAVIRIEILPARELGVVSRAFELRLRS